MGTRAYRINHIIREDVPTFTGMDEEIFVFLEDHDRVNMNRDTDRGYLKRRQVGKGKQKRFRNL